MELATILFVIGLGVIVLLAAWKLITRKPVDVGPLTQFDQYGLPAREDFVLESVDDLDDLVFEGIVLYGLKSDECEALCAFAANHIGCHYGDIFRAFFREQLELED